ncbi:MAG: DsbA family protein [Hyphomicrobium sp.]
MAEFGEGRQIDDGDLLLELMAARGGDPQEAFRGSQTDNIKAALKQSTDEAIAPGVFGAPSFATADGELFWGNDRLEQALLWSIQQPRDTLLRSTH